MEAALVMPTNASPALGSVVSDQALDLSEDTIAILISLYFDNVQPVFPLFRKETFQTDLRADRVPKPLLYMMLALASRYVLPSEMLQTFGQNVVEPWEHFARMGFEKSRFNEANDSSTPISLGDVKTLFLLTLHEYTSFPGRKAWMRVGNTVRAAISAGLHRIDQPNHCSMSLISEAEMEEWRFTWWAVWRVDSSINILASSPFNIETRDIHTALPSTSVANFTCGIITPCSADFLPADAIRPWRSIQDLQWILSKDSLYFYLHTVSYNREAMTCRRRLYLNPTLELMSEFNDLKQAFPYLRAALPCPFLSGARQPTGETIDEHRRRLETLILLHITEVILYLPIRERDFDNTNHVQQKRLVADWQICIDNIEEMAALLRHWEPSYSKFTDPMLSCIIWVSSSILVLHTMSASYQQAKESGHWDSVEDSLKPLSAALKGFARYWPIASLLLESLQGLLSWNWLSLSFQDVLFVASQLQAPIDPEAQNPATINIWPVFSNPSQEFLEDPQLLKCYMFVLESGVWLLGG
ncbi:fungal-specific transcription factor domain-containing protein [Bisporella sp. PMI_857]|nr:fungal-specific transcription factor domain-containing protein [Bisporella sp. PMI_857]